MGSVSDGAQPPLTGPRHPEQPPESDKPTAANPWYRRVSFWRAVAGMAVAIALGCAMIVLETASELSWRSTNFHHRLNLLGSRVSRMRAQIVNAERQLSTLRAERAARANINRILSAPDVMLLRLAPGAASGTPRGIVAISREAGDAILEVAGLPAAADHAYVMWWLPVQGAPAKAAEFHPGADERVSVVAQMPPRGARIAGAMITLEPGKSPAKPNGAVMLKGTLPKAQTLS